MNHRYVIGGVAFRTNETLPGLAESGFADITVDIRFVGEDELASLDVDDHVHVAGPGDLDGVIAPGSAMCWLPDRFSDPVDRAWHLRQMAPIFSTILGRLVLHAGAVAINTGVVGFIGATGAGKSTLTRFLTDRGHRFVADDLLPIRFTPIPSAPVNDRLVPLRSLHFLRRDNTDSVTIEPLKDLEALQQLARNGFGEHGNSESWAFQFDAYHRIVESVPIFDLTIPDDHNALARVEAALADRPTPSAEASSGETPR